jgi:hypothetical protein
MNFGNYGNHVAGAGYKQRWQIGHRLPFIIYDVELQDDMRRCFSTANIFPQDSRENVELCDKLALNDKELLALKHVWPSRANGDLQTLKSMFRFTDNRVTNPQLDPDSESECELVDDEEDDEEILNEVFEAGSDSEEEDSDSDSDEEEEDSDNDEEEKEASASNGVTKSQLLAHDGCDSDSD